MVKIDKLLNGYEKFYDDFFVKQPEVYEKLVYEGQSPKTLVIACSDSRVDPSILFNTSPGDIFVIRNVANLVPPFDSDMSHCHGTSAAIEYAVNHLKVENIVILGHSHCGGIKALFDEHSADNTFINTWLNIVDENKVSDFLSEYSEQNSCMCEKKAIQISMDNLLTFPFVKDSVETRNLNIYGWYFNMQTGKLEKI